MAEELKAGYHRSFAALRAMNAPDAKDTLLLVALTATAPPQLSGQLADQGIQSSGLRFTATLVFGFLGRFISHKS